MNHIHWSKRIFISAAILCLAVTSSGAQPVGASLPASDYMLNLSFQRPAEPICIYKDVHLTVTASVSHISGLIPNLAFTSGWMKADAKVGAITPREKVPIPRLFLGEEKEFDFTYTPVSTGRVTVTLHGEMPGVGQTDNSLSFEVSRCEWNFHAVTDTTIINGTKLVVPFWEPVGTYDISGTFKITEDGIHGQAVANLFMDAYFIGGSVDGISCRHVDAWEGNTTVEIEADPNAWAQEDTLDLEFRVQPMLVATTRIECTSSSGTGGVDTPDFTVAAMELHFDSLPASGGNTSLNFTFPSGRGELKMDLIVSPQEAES